MTFELARRAYRGEFDAEVLRWIRSGMQRWLDDDEELETALGIDRPQLVRACHAALRRAAEIVGGNTPWQTAGRLEQAISHFESRTMPFWGRHGRPIDIGALDEALEAVFMTGVRFPKTARKLYEIIA